MGPGCALCGLRGQRKDFHIFRGTRRLIGGSLCFLCLIPLTGSHIDWRCLCMAWSFITPWTWEWEYCTGWLWNSLPVQNSSVFIYAKAEWLAELLGFDTRYACRSICVWSSASPTLKVCSASPTPEVYCISEKKMGCQALPQASTSKHLVTKESGDYPGTFIHLLCPGS